MKRGKKNQNQIIKVLCFAHLKLMNNANYKDETPLRPLPLSPIPKLPKGYTAKNKNTIVMCSIMTALLSIHS